MNASKQRVALVTGAGRGIGRGIAIQLAADGYAVAINALTGSPQKTDDGSFEVKKTIEAAGGIADVFLADVGEIAMHSSLVESVVHRFGRVDLLVNNAGVAPKQRTDVLEGDEASYDRLLRINLKGPYFLTQRVARRMIEWQKDGTIERGRIVFVSSISAYTTSTNRGEYCISKAGLSMASMLFADRLAEFNIPVIEVRPGIVRTPMTGPVTEKYDKLIAEGLLPIKRWGEPEDIARPVAAIARGDFDYSTGIAIEISGGFSLRRL